jgi:hypothetical protein
MKDVTPLSAGQAAVVRANDSTTVRIGDLELLGRRDDRLGT